MMTIPSVLPFQPVGLVAFTSAFLLYYHIAAPYYPSTKQRAWILTAGSSCIMTCASLPFLWDFVASGWTVYGVRTASLYANTVAAFFQAYLLADLILATLYYSEHVNLLSGWIHHMMYIIVTDCAARHSLSHVFVLGACMELPTFILSLGTLHAKMRSNLLFALTFFATRIVLNIVFLVSYSSPSARHNLLGGSFAPAFVLAFALALHSLWFFKCLKGNLRRYDHRVRSLKGKYAEVAEKFRRRRWSRTVAVAPTTAPTVGSAPTLQKVRGPRGLILRMRAAAAAATYLRRP